MTDFPTLRPVLELAFGADPDGDPDDWTFVDVSADMLKDDTTITRGRSDESSQTDATSVAFILDNNSGDYTPDRATSPHYPNVRQNVPVRFSIAGLPAELGGPDPVVRFTGFVSDWAPAWPVGDHSDGEDGEGHAVITLTANGVMRRESQGGEPLSSALARTTTRRDDVVAYWPCEEPQGSSQAASPIRGVAPIRPTVDVSFAANSDHGAGAPQGVEFGAGEDHPGGSAPAAIRVSEGTGGVLGTVPAHPAATVYQIHELFRFDAVDGSQRDVLNVYTSGTVDRWRLTVNSTNVQLRGFNGDTQLFSNTVSTSSVFAGRWLLVNLFLEQDGSGIGWAYTIRTADRALTVINQADGARASSALGRVTQAGLGPGRAGPGAPDRYVSHITVRRDLSAWALPFDDAAVHGYTGERAAVRFERLCHEEQQRCYVQGAPELSAPMGPQRPHDLLTLLRQCADTDGGIFYEGVANFGYALRLRADMYNQDAALELDAADGPGEITHPFTPTADDQQFRNDVTVENEAGSSARLTDPQSIHDHGRYTESWPVNTSDGRLLVVAGWRLHLGTWPGMRYPAVSPALSQVPDLIGGWLGVDLGDRISVTGLPPQHPAGEVDLLAQGYTETFTEETWAVEVNATPARPWNVWELEHETFGRGWSSRPYLAEDIDASATSFDVIVPVRRPMNSASDFEGPFTSLQSTDAGVFSGVDWVYRRLALEQSSAQAFRGRKSLKLTPDGTGVTSIRSGIVPASIGRTHSVSAWVYAPVGGFDARVVAMTFVTSSGTSASFNGPAVTVPSGQWVRLHRTITPTATQPNLAMRVEYVGTPSASNVLFVDDAEIGLPGAPFTTDSGDFPQDIIIGGEVMTVTDISADDGTGRQVFTVTRAVNNVSKSHRAGSPVDMHPGHVIPL